MSKAKTSHRIAHVQIDLGRCYLEKHDFPNAMQWLEKSLKSEKGELRHHFTHYYLGLAYKGAGLSIKAIAAMSKSAEILSLSKKMVNVDPFIVLGDLYYEKGNSEKALLNYKLAAKALENWQLNNMPEAYAIKKQKEIKGKISKVIGKLKPFKSSVAFMISATSQQQEAF